ncbi:UNVERIFIED_CONTAM: hypothetical protein K2H54_016555 [Gekko kuhli]
MRFLACAQDSLLPSSNFRSLSFSQALRISPCLEEHVCCSCRGQLYWSAAEPPTYESSSTSRVKANLIKLITFYITQLQLFVLTSFPVLSSVFNTDCDLLIGLESWHSLTRKQKANKCRTVSTRGLICKVLRTLYKKKNQLCEREKLQKITEFIYVSERERSKKKFKFGITGYIQRRQALN